jgi:hypothetical protein
MKKGGVYVDTHYFCSDCGAEWPALVPFGEGDPWTSAHRPKGWQAYYCMEGLYAVVIACEACRKKYDADEKWRVKPRGM